MRVMINGVIYDSKKEHISIELSFEELNNMRAMMNRDEDTYVFVEKPRPFGPYVRCKLWAQGSLQNDDKQGA